MPPQGFTKAVRKKTSLLVGFAGPPSSGKTYSAMLFASGISDEPFIVIDTEGERALHYADQFTFEHRALHPPFHPDRYLKEIQDAEKRGFQTIIIDSGSHEWEGQGGIVEMADKSTLKSPLNWAKPKAEHHKFVHGLIQCKAHLVICLRAREKIKLEDDPKNPGKKVVIPLGWMPIAEKGFLHEMTVSFTMSAENPGLIDTSLPHKLQDQHTTAFQNGKYVTAESGRILGAWARGEPIEGPDIELWLDARAVSHDGTEDLREFWLKLDAEGRRKLAPIVDELKNNAQKADENRANRGL